MRPWYKKKKFGVAIAGGLVQAAGEYFQWPPEFRQQLFLITLGLLGAIMGEDWGKAKAEIEGL